MGLSQSLGLNIRSAEWKSWSEVLRIHGSPLGRVMSSGGPYGKGKGKPKRTSRKVMVQGKARGGDIPSRE